MIVRKLYAAALGLSLGLSAVGVSRGQEASPAAQSNQQMANAIAARFKQSPLLQHYRVAVSFQGGVADLTGTVQNAAQREEVVRLAQSVPGVERVRDQLQLVSSGIVLTQGPPPIPLPPVGQVNPLPVNPPLPPPVGVPMFPGPMPAPNIGGIQEPTPIFQAPPGFPNATQPPPMPPYAWPTVAPYNNYSRVAYPSIYPYESFPFIGPFYPFPRVPLGWRSVTLTWQDGHWWFQRSPTGQDWWRVRYW